MKVFKWVPPHLRVSTPVLLTFGLLFFSFHRPGPLPAQLPNVSWFPTISCEEAWDGKNLARYDFSQDTRFSKEFKGNQGYANYQERIFNEFGIKRQECFKEWTILVYMAANNDLVPFAFWDLYEMEARYPMERAASTLESDLVVDLQTENTPLSHRIHLFQSEKTFNKDKTKEEFISMDLDQIHSPIAGQVKSAELTPEENLYDFIEWGVKQYPAQNYMVVIWGHGQGWASDPGDSANLFSGRFGGLAFQKFNKEFLTTPALSRVLERIENEVFEGQDKIDVYASDACLMQQLEVAYEIAPHTRYIIGSTQTQTYMGLPYRRMMYEINRGCYNTREKDHPHCDDNLGLQEKGAATRKLKRLCGDDKACYLAQMVPKLTLQSFSRPTKSLQYPGDPKAIETLTMSSLRSNILRHDLPKKLNQLGGELNQFFKNATFEQREEFLNIMKSFETYPGDTREFTIAIGKMENFFKQQGQEKIWLSLQDFDHWLGELVIDKAFGKSFFQKNYHLMSPKLISLWIPSGPEVLLHRELDYQDSRLYEDLSSDDLGNQWLAWMKELYLLNLSSL